MTAHPYSVARRTVDATSLGRHHGRMDDQPSRRGPPPNQEIRDRILATAAQHPDWSNRQIAAELKCGRRTVRSVLEPAQHIPGKVMRIRADYVAKAQQCGLSVNDVLDRALAHIVLPSEWTPDQVMTPEDDSDDEDGAR